MRLNRFAALTAATALMAFAVQAHSADEPAKPKGNCHVAGHIGGPDGKSVAGATVTLISKTPAKTADAPAPAKKPRKKPGADAAGGLTATTDADGNFKLDDVPAGQYTLRAMLKGYGRSVQQINLTDGQTLSDVKMQLAKKAT